MRLPFRDDTSISFQKSLWWMPPDSRTSSRPLRSSSVRSSSDAAVLMFYTGTGERLKLTFRDVAVLGLAGRTVGEPVARRPICAEDDDGRRPRPVAVAVDAGVEVVVRQHLLGVVEPIRRVLAGGVAEPVTPIRRLGV